MSSLNNRREVAGPPVTERTDRSRRAKYERPSVTTYDSERILKQIGPAQGYSGAPPGTEEWSL